MGELARAIARGDQITAYCSRCDHSAELDLTKLKDGDGVPHDVIVPQLRCSECGSKDLTIRISPGSALRVQMGRVGS